MTRKTAVQCPFCRADQAQDKLHTRFYACGTTADRTRGTYRKACKCLDNRDRTC